MHFAGEEKMRNGGMPSRRQGGATKDSGGLFESV